MISFLYYAALYLFVMCVRCVALLYLYFPFSSGDKGFCGHLLQHYFLNSVYYAVKGLSSLSKKKTR